MGPVGKRAAGDRLRSHGLRATAQRRAILTVFDVGGLCHLSADEVLARAREELPELSRATVYNTLSEFAAAGLLRPVSGGRTQLYEAGIEPHEHFRCLSCGRLYDVHVSTTGPLTLAEEGFAVSSVLLEGTCPECAASPS